MIAKAILKKRELRFDLEFYPNQTSNGIYMRILRYVTLLLLAR